MRCLRRVAIGVRVSTVGEVLAAVLRAKSEGRSWRSAQGGRRTDVLSAGEGLDDEHRRAAVRTHERRA